MESDDTLKNSQHLLDKRGEEEEETSARERGYVFLSFSLFLRTKSTVKTENRDSSRRKNEKERKKQREREKKGVGYRSHVREQARYRKGDSMRRSKQRGMNIPDRSTLFRLGTRGWRRRRRCGGRRSGRISVEHSKDTL